MAIALEAGPTAAPPRVPGVAFYCVADRRYFLGAVGLVNSLRLVGHTEPVFLLDCGLTPSQRELLRREVTLVPAPSDSPAPLLTPAAPLAHPADVMVLVDADLLVTRPLTDLIETASRGRLVAFRAYEDRFASEWGALLDLGPVRRQPYVGAALICTDGRLGSRVLGLLDEHQGRIDFELTWWRRKVADYPLLYADQDVLNAILASRVERERLVVLDSRLEAIPPFDGLGVIDERTLRCAYQDGVEPYVVHHYLVKPWLQPTHHGVYSRLLRRLLIAPDVAVKVPERQLPLRMRSGLLAYADRKRVNARERFRWYVGEPLASRMRALSRLGGKRSRGKESEAR